MSPALLPRQNPSSPCRCRPSLFITAAAFVFPCCRFNAIEIAFMFSAYEVCSVGDVGAPRGIVATVQIAPKIIHDCKQRLGGLKLELICVAVRDLLHLL